MLLMTLEAAAVKTGGTAVALRLPLGTVELDEPDEPVVEAEAAGVLAAAEDEEAAAVEEAAGVEAEPEPDADAPEVEELPAAAVVVVPAAAVVVVEPLPTGGGTEMGWPAAEHSETTIEETTIAE